MKFLCVDCDTAMTLTETRGPDDGSMAIVYGCPTCGRRIAMLTNSMETQMVRSLGVKIGGRSTPVQPMEMLRSSLANQREHVAEAAPSEPDPQPPSAGKCPFPGVVEEAFARQRESDGPEWTEEARARIDRVPSFIRAMVRKGVEDYARQQGCSVIDTDVMDAVKGRLGM